MNHEKIKRMVGVALLSAVIVVLQLISGFLHLGPVSITLVLIPIIIGGAAYGVRAGTILGGVFGVIVCICSAYGIDPGGAMVFQANPFLCILVVMAKGILAGAISAWVYHILEKKNGFVAMLCAAIVCPVVNTGVFLLCMSLFFMDVLRVWAGGTDVVGYVLSGLVLLNFLPELAINVILSPASQQILRTVKKK